MPRGSYAVKRASSFSTGRGSRAARGRASGGSATWTARRLHPIQKIVVNHCGIHADICTGFATYKPLQKIMNHCGIHADIWSGCATYKRTVDARHAAKPLLITEWMPQ